MLSEIVDGLAAEAAFAEGRGERAVAPLALHEVRQGLVEWINHSLGAYRFRVGPACGDESERHRAVAAHVDAHAVLIVIERGAVVPRHRNETVLRVFNVA